VDVVDAVRGRDAHLGRERDQLASDAERDRLRGRQLRLAIAELDARDVVAVRSGGDRGGELRRVDVAARPRRDDVHEIAELMAHWPQAEYNIEGNPFHNLMAFVRELGRQGHAAAPGHLRARQRRATHLRPRLAVSRTTRRRSRR